MYDVLYDEFIETYESITGNVIKIVLGVFNTKCGREQQYFPCIGKIKFA